MKLRMSDKSLFAILLRSPWWISLVVAVAVAAAARAIAPERYAIAAMLGCLPFVVIAGLAAFRQWRAPSASAVSGTLERLAAMPWKEFSPLVRAALEREGFAVTPLVGGGEADFKATKPARTVLVCARRFKARATGADTFRAFAAQLRREDASEARFVTLVPVAETGRQAARTEGVRLVEQAELAAWMQGLVPVGAPR